MDMLCRIFNNMSMFIFQLWYPKHVDTMEYWIQNKHNKIINKLLYLKYPLSADCLLQAIQQQNLELIRKLLDNRCPINNKCITACIESGDHTFLKEILNHPVSEDIWQNLRHEYQGIEYLRETIRDRNTERIDLLLKNQCPMNHKNIIAAISINDKNICEKLLQAGCSMNTRDANERENCLIVALSTGDMGFVNMLLSYNAPICEMISDFAIDNYDFEFIKRLQRLEPNLYFPQYSIYTAIERGDLDMVDFFLSRPHYHDTCSYVTKAYDDGNMEMMKLLLRHKCHVSKCVKNDIEREKRLAGRSRIAMSMDF